MIALIQLLALTWVAKAVWAPLVDRYGSRRLGHYRGWLLVLQVLMVVAILALGPVDLHGQLPLLVAVIGVVALLSATQDIAADATAVRLLAPSERGVGNGIQKAGGYFGYMVGALDAGRAAAVPGRPGHGVPAGHAHAGGCRMAAGPDRHRLDRRRWRRGHLASLAAGLLVTELGRRLALVMFGVVQVAAIAALLPLARGTGGALSGLAAVALLNAAYAIAGTAVYTINMDWSRPGSAGTDYTVQDSFVHLCWQLAGSLGLGLAGGLGYPTMLAVSLVLGLAGVGAVAWPLGGDPGGITGASPGDRDDRRPASDHQPLGGAHAGRRRRDRGRTGQARSSNGRRRPRGQADRLGDQTRAHGAGLRVQRGGPGPDDRSPGG
jgi:acetyl-CoA transporter-like protein